jgi:hypothetical protein
MNETQLKHLQAIADALIAHGYEVEEPFRDYDLLDVWGFENRVGSKRRRKCFEEIYCTIIEVNGLCVSYWTTSSTYDSQDSSIEIEETHNGLRGINELIHALSVQPIKKRKAA